LRHRAIVRAAIRSKQSYLRSADATCDEGTSELKHPGTVALSNNDA